MVELESQVTDQSAGSPVEDAGGIENLKTRTLNEDNTSRILLSVIAVCGFGAILTLAFALGAGLAGVLGLDLPGVTAVGDFLSSPAGVLLTIILVVTTLTSYFFLRRRVNENSMLYTDSGCPRCWEKELIRVRRHKPDRVIALLGIPVRRYNCRNCDWGGLRIGGTPPGVEIQPNLSPTDYFWGRDEILGVGHGETAARKNQ